MTPRRNETRRVDDDRGGMAEWAGQRAFEDVLVAARTGDGPSFAEIWRWLHPPLVRWLSVVVSGDVEDIESEVWLSITRNLASFSGDERDFRGWVFTIARRRAIDWRRHRRRQPRVTDLDGVDVAGHGSSSPGTDTAAALAMLATLTPEQREALALRVIVGMSVRETAAVVQRTEGAVRILCHRGLRTLSRQLAADRPAEEIAP
jgi:RNA polymerase sigma-70 factor (ECF subfamily)